MNAISPLMPGRLWRMSPRLMVRIGSVPLGFALAIRKKPKLWRCPGGRFIAAGSLSIRVLRHFQSMCRMSRRLLPRCGNSAKQPWIAGRTCLGSLVAQYALIHEQYAPGAASN